MEPPSLLSKVAAMFPDRRIQADGIITFLLCKLIALGLCFFTSSAHAAAVCPDPPGTAVSSGDYVECTEDNTSTDDITITITEGVNITTTGENEHPVHAKHQGVGDIDIEIIGTSTDKTISAGGAQTFGVFARHEGKGNVDISIENATITLTDTSQGVARGGVVGEIVIQTSGVPPHPPHDGTYHVKIDVTDSTISTASGSANGIYSVFQGHNDNFIAGSNEITVKNTDIMTTGLFAPGVEAFSIRHTGDIVLKFEDGMITTAGQQAMGLFARAGDDNIMGESGNVTVTIKNAVINANYVPDPMNPPAGNVLSHGVVATNSNGGTGDVSVIMTDSTVTSDAASGVIVSRANGVGKVVVDIRGGTITAKGRRNRGVLAWHLGQGDVELDVRDTTIISESTELNERGRTDSHGIWGTHYNSDPTANTGNVRIGLHGNASIRTAGAFSYGIYGDNFGEEGQNIIIETHGGSSIINTGSNGHGIVAHHAGSSDTRTVDITVGGTIDVQGTGAQAVQIGEVSGGVPAYMAAIGSDDYRQQAVTVNGPITSAGEGVFLANGGRVIIGPQGSIDSGLGIAILATGTVPEVPEDNTDPDNVIPAVPAIPPKLYVNLQLEGRRIADVIGDDWIINDGGETTIAVNDVVLHDGATGVTGNMAHNGIWDITMLAAGVNVTDYLNADPAMWTVSPRSESLIADRDFSVEDFTEQQVECPAGQIGTPPHCRIPPPPRCPAGQVGTPPHCRIPPPPRCPAGQIGTPPNCIEPEPICPAGQVDTPPNCIEPEPISEPMPEPISEPMLIEEYAPRAALYEALPDVLLDLQASDLTGQRQTPQPQPQAWIRLAGGSASQDFERSTVGAAYDADSFTVEAGATVWQTDVLDVQASLHHIKGSVDVSSPNRGGDIRIRGKGVSVDTHWHDKSGHYVSARLSLTDFDMDLSSDNVGRLASGLDAEGLGLHVSGGKRMRWGERSHWTPHARLDYTKLSIGSFTDAVDARASFPDAKRYRGGIGVLAETLREVSRGDLSLQGSVHLERTFGGSRTSSRVSGTRLTAKPQNNTLQLGLGGAWQRGPWLLSGTFSAREALGSGGNEYSGSVQLRMLF